MIIIKRKKLQKSYLSIKIARKTQHIRNKLGSTIRNSTKSFGNAMKKASYQKSPFCVTKQTKKRTDNNLNKPKFSICKKEQVSVGIKLPGFVISSMAVTVTWNEAEPSSYGNQADKKDGR